MDCTHDGSFVVGAARRPNQPTAENVAGDLRLAALEDTSRWPGLRNRFPAVRHEMVGNLISNLVHALWASYMHRKGVLLPQERELLADDFAVLPAHRFCRVLLPANQCSTPRAELVALSQLVSAVGATLCPR